MLLSTYENVHNPPVLRPTSHGFKGVNGALKRRGTFPSITSSTKGKYTRLTFMLPINNLLSRTMTEKMNLNKLNIQ